MIIDDVHIKTVRLLKNFMDCDTRWERVENFDEKTLVYRKLTNSVHDVSWHMQPYSFKNANAHRVKKIAKRAMGYVRRKVLG
jgi:arginyl-tRNA--protein-N-Asp/Glu arginylyltransferase